MRIYFRLDRNVARTDLQHQLGRSNSWSIFSAIQFRKKKLLWIAANLYVNKELVQIANAWATKAHQNIQQNWIEKMWICGAVCHAQVVYHYRSLDIAFWKKISRKAENPLRKMWQNLLEKYRIFNRNARENWKKVQLATNFTKKNRSTTYRPTKVNIK